MKISSPVSRLEKMNVWLFAFLLFAFQLIFTFQGFDMADEGFHATFYQRIFSDPESVQFNFMFWLSGIVGGILYWLFGGLGLWGLRLEGVLTITFTLIITYQLLKKYINPGHLKLGLLLVVLLFNNNRKTIYYDNLSLLFYVAVIYYLFTGLKENKSWKLLLAGLIAGVNIFNRPPNVTAIGLVVVIIFYGFLYKNNLLKQFKQTVLFAGGMAVAVIATVVLMKAIGHYDLFTNSLKLVASMGADETNTNYGVMNIIKNYYPPYTNSLRDTLLIFLLLLIAIVLPRFIKIGPVLRNMLRYALGFFVLAFLAVMIYNDKDENVISLYLFAGVSIVAGILILISNTDKNIKVLMLAGAFIVAAYPLGSSAGLYTVGINTFWIAFPIALDYLLNIKTVDNNLVLASKPSTYSLRFNITEPELGRMKLAITALIGLACLFHVYFYPYFDRHNRKNMSHSIDNKYLRGIYTTEERARSFNELLSESKKYIKPGDEVLAYDCMPGFHYATQTRPYMRNSWPYLYSSKVFNEELHRASDSATHFPVVVMQTIKTIGSGDDWPTTPLKYDAEWEQRNKGRNAALNEFLNSHHYQEVWTNGMFKILVAASR